MAFNVINTKHREAPDVWLKIKDADGKQMYADKSKKKPVQIKFKSPYGDAFRKSFLSMQVKLSRLKSGQQQEIKEMTPEEIETNVVKAFAQAEDMAIDLITEMAIDWDGFFDEDGNAIEFDPQTLRFVVSQLENYHVFNQIREAFKNHEDFIVA